MCTKEEEKRWCEPSGVGPVVAAEGGRRVWAWGLHSGVEEWRRLGGEKKGRTKPLTECLPFIEKERIQFWHM